MLDQSLDAVDLEIAEDCIQIVAPDLEIGVAHVNTALGKNEIDNFQKFHKTIFEKKNKND